MVNTPVRDYVSTAGDDTTPSWLIQQQPLWFCDPKDECKEDESEKSSDGYIPAEPFLEHLLDPYGWHDILATLDVCAEKVNATKHCDNEGYDIRSLNVMSVILEEGICSDKSIDSRHESIILEGPEADTSRIRSVYYRNGKYEQKNSST